MIHRTTSTLLVAVLASGCVIRGEYRAASYAGNAALVGAGIYMLRTTATTCDNPLDHCPAPNHDIETNKLIGGSLLAVGVVGLALQIAGDVQPESVTPPADVPAPEPSHANTTDVRVMTDDARAYAKRGECADVRNLAHRVSVLDPPYFRNVFEVDPDISSCMY
ncbi:MAG TPA: hypothetical protein VL463_23715 [Kofleriaceae bacterium]|jgi:hypothetical protein|nr:hypothetical protein [Kofleriaceae bacterium]